MALRNIPPLSRAQIERFWSRVDIKGKNECWPWIAARSTVRRTPAYGAFSPNATQTFGAHRIAYFLSTGDDPFGLLVRHLVCDNPPCCNPAHLAKGTHWDNAEDKRLKGRTCTGDRNGARLHPEKWKRGDAHWSRLHPEKVARGKRHGSKTRPEKVNRGSAHGMSRLTELKVLDIRAAYANGTRIVDLAGMYNVTKGAIDFIVRRKTWRHI